MEAEVVADSSKLERTFSKRMPAGSIRLQFAGDLILASRPDKDYMGLFRRYETLLEVLANQDVKERLINYKILNALMLTSHAKKMTDVARRRSLFDLKNALYFDLVNQPESRKKVSLKYLVSSHFRVVQYCEACTTANSGTDQPRHKWRFCDKCDVDRSFYNVMALQHKIPDGTATIFLSNDLIPQIKNSGLHSKGKRENFEEEASYKNYRYNVRNLDAIDLDSVLKMNEKLLKKK